MIKVVTFKILIAIFCALVVIYVFFVFAEIPNKKNNGFKRNWIVKKVEVILEKKISLPSNRICGISNNSIYVTAENPQHILVFNKKLDVIDTLFVNMTIEPNKIVPNFLEIDSPMIFLHLNNLETIFSGDISSKSLRATKLNTGIFLRSVQLTPTTLAIRCFDNSLTNMTFKKINTMTGSTFLTKNFLGEDIGDGFANDGMLLYEKFSNKLIFVKYFKNQFFCADTNFNLVLKGNTIDTTFTGNSKMGIELHGKEAKLVPSNARVQVNKYAFLGNSLLYIQSDLRSDNENLSDFIKMDDIDIYNISHGKYLGTISLEKEDNQSFKSAKVMKDTLIVLYPRKIVMYKLPKHLS